MNVVSSILAVFSGITDWFGDTLATLSNIFYNTTDNELTFIGVVAIVGLGIAVVTMLIAMIRSLLKGRG